jgi:hypothetical protein
MPRQAVSLKKNRCGTMPVSNVSDNEHTTASLGHSVELSVQNSVCEPIPEFCQHPEEGTKIASSVTGQHSGDVLPNQPLGAVALSNGAKDEHEVATRVIQSLSESGDAETLAGSSSDENIDICIRPSLELGHVAPVWDVGVVVRQYG